MIFSLFTQLKAFFLGMVAILSAVVPFSSFSQYFFATNSPNTHHASSKASRNWAGYAATNGKFTAVSGTWTIPTVSGGNYLTSDSSWIGIGGILKKDLIQAGTENTVSPTGGVTTSAFYETIPYLSQPIPIAVHVGDTISVAISQESPNNWLLSFTNQTSGQNFQKTIPYNSSLSSAEWIEEAPSNGASIIPIDNFGTVAFTHASVVRNGYSELLSSGNAQAISLVNKQKQHIATPSTLISDGSFRVTRSSVVWTTPIPEEDKKLSQFELMQQRARMRQIPFPANKGY